MRALYSAGVRAYGLALRLAVPFHPKAAAWVRGRRHFPEPVKDTRDASLRIWFHCASLGEFEQGRPVMEALKSRYPSSSLILTFFSPSGYQIRKDYPLASQVEYLPLDTAANAKRFVSLFRPHLAVFVKYEFWFHHLDELKNNQIPYLFISSVFRPGQVFFSSWGGWFRRRLAASAGIFVQDQASLELLKGIGIEQAFLSGDTRYDRVSKIASEARDINEIEDFIQGRPCLVAGSTWPGDERMLGGIMESMPEDLCIILAPHEIGAARIRSVTGVFPDTFLLYSRREQARGDERVMVIDNIGMLSSIYRYASVAWVGGGFGSGLHNILEPAAHGKPVIFGPDHRKFPEASALIAAGGAFSVKDPAEATKCLLSLLRDPQYARLTGERSKSFVESQRGACEKIVLYCSELIAQVARNAGAGAHRR